MTQPHATSPRVINGLSADAADTAAPKAALPVLELDKRTYARGLDCVHCGLCLPACPTYTENGLEADSPRGRIMLMLGLADGKVEPTPAVLGHLDGCLDCRACETACPSGVVYHELIEETRQRLAVKSPRPLGQRIVELICHHLFPYPGRLKAALLPARLLQKAGLWGPLTRSPLTRVLPPHLRKMQQMLPPGGPLWESSLADHYPATRQTDTGARVAFFAGCVGSVLFQDVNRKTIDLLRRGGCDVAVPRAQRCCGAIHHHGGALGPAIALAKANIDAFLPRGGEPPKWIINNIAGCGAMLKEYPHLLRDDPEYAERANEFSARVRDISEVLVELDLGLKHRVERRATYHDACHLAHGQKVTDPPRELLARVPGLELVDLPESEMCCGAAGTYNLTQPEMATALAERKIDKVRSTGASVCVTGNVGCAMQIQSEARRLGHGFEVVHPVAVLHEAAFGPTR